MRAVVDLVSEQRRATIRTQMDIVDRQLEQGIHGTMAGNDHQHAGKVRDQHVVDLAPAAPFHQARDATVQTRARCGCQALRPLVCHQPSRANAPVAFELLRHGGIDRVHPWRRLPMPLRIRNRRHLHAKQVIEKRPVGPRHLAFPRSVVMQGPVGLAKRVGCDQLGQSRVPAAFVQMRRERPAHVTEHQGESDLSAKVPGSQAQALIPTTILHLGKPADRARSGA